MKKEAEELARRAEARLIEALRDEPSTFQFFQAVRLLAKLYPDRAPVGQWSDPSTEVARFGASTSLAFPPSEIHSLDLPTVQKGRPSPARMVVNFFGLTGPQGVLPHFYSEHATARVRAKDEAFRDFLDLFQHRALSLFYRAWEKHRAAVLQERKAEDRFEAHLFDAAGFGLPGHKRRLPVEDSVLAYYAGLLALHCRSAEGLARLVGDYFGVPAEVEQFVGEWRHVERGGQGEVGAEDMSGQLGFGVLGSAAWDAQARVRLRLGPLARDAFDAFIPGGSAHPALCALARLYTDDDVGVDAQLVLAREEVRPVRLDVEGPGGGAARPALGMSTWLTSRRMGRDPDETLLRLC